MIKGTVGDDFRGDIAIDDLSFLNCEPYEGNPHAIKKNILEFSQSSHDLCVFWNISGDLPTVNHTIPAVTPPAPTSQPHNCPEGQFVCKAQGECVSGNKVCDFRPDCSDGSDEFGCGKTFREFLSEFPHCSFSSPPPQL